ncbi:MAG: cytochrome c biogenesis protein DipZ [Chloroflexota bacterium]|nr:cytochrome c biogenesis protein DipZ [Chloroflexota bacterium]
MFTIMSVAFLAGLLTIVSPCVLPVLPLLLSTSAGGGKWRPLGITLGFATTFTVALLTVQAAAEAFALPVTWLRYFSIVAVGLLGLTMLVPALGRAWERLLSPVVRLGSRGTDTRRHKGFLGGLALGAGLSLVWSPCVGPVMGTVFLLTAGQGFSGITANVLAITFSYALGGALPMLFIGYGTRSLAKRFKQLAPRTRAARTLFGALTVATCVGLLFGLDNQFQAFAQRNLPAEWTSALTSVERQPSVQKELTALQAEPAQLAAAPETAYINPGVLHSRPAPTATPKPQLQLQDMGPAPEVTGITGWFNTARPLSLQSLRGKVVIVDFWTFACYNCQNTVPYVRKLYDKYHSQGLEIIGVHSPEFAYERVPDNIKNAAHDQGINWPIAMDPDFKTWRAYNNSYWPAFYFIDAKGHLRYTHFGEGNYDFHDKVVEQLLYEARSTK